ncbi:MAG: alkaline phosphatase D family protein [Deltaproteobacteria bacterium]|nr:alkaline phosphatase D family protein [Deltaproteobacteria bacterium]
MQRRAFLQTTVVAAGAVLARCGDDPKPTAAADASGDGGPGDAAVAGETQADAAGATGPDKAWFPQSVCSGDPRSESAIVWTRAVDASKPGADIALQLVVATDKDLKNVVQLGGKAAQSVTAKAAHDGCVRVKVTGLQAGTTYWYRFASADGAHHTATGRFKTAPKADADVAVKFAVVSCQDYNGKYYNSYARLIKEDVDFFVHLGDYVYETTGNPEFQNVTADRVVIFSDTAGAIAFGPKDKPTYYAAKSLSNYRDLYKTYRGDPDMQKMHESAAMIAVWDDHEFSDDCWQTQATYFDGQKDENDPGRRANADQAWFEYMPVDYPAGADFEFDPKAAFPGNLRIYRDFDFGKHLHLAMTDLRRYRADHVVPEDALPGGVALLQEELQALAGKVPELAQPYLDIDAHDGGKYAKFFKDNAATLKISAAKVKGPVAVPWINARLKDLEKTPGAPAPIADADAAKLPKGLSFGQMLKFSGYGALGSRYLVTRTPFELYAKAQWDKTKGESEQILGADQEKWFLDSMTKATQTWKVWGNEYTLQRREIDLSALASLPEAFRQRFLLSAEDWDGAPNRRDKILAALAKVPNSVVVSGDIHAFFAGTPMLDSDPTQKVVEFVTGAISSGTYQTLLLRQASSDPDLKAAGADGLAMLANNFLLGIGTGPVNPNLGYCHVEWNGFMVLQAAGDYLSTTFWQAEESVASKRQPDDKLDGLFAPAEFRTKAGSRDLEHKIKGAWKTWDPKAYDWK